MFGSMFPQMSPQQMSPATVGMNILRQSQQMQQQQQQNPQQGLLQRLLGMGQQNPNPMAGPAPGTPLNIAPEMGGGGGMGMLSRLFGG